MREPLRVVAFVEAVTVTGPAGNLIRLCRLAREEGSVQISIAAFHRPAPGESLAASNPFFEAVRAAGIELDIIPEKKRFDRSVVPVMREILERRRADIVQTHAVKSHFLARWGGLRRGRRWIAFNHGYTAENLTMRLYIMLDRWSLPGADRVVAVCGAFAKDLVARGMKPGGIDILPNSIRPVAPPAEDVIRGVRERLGLSGGEKVIISAGRFSSEKAHSDLVRAFSLIAKENSALPARLILIGDGIERRNLEDLVTSLGLAGKVIFAGHQGDIWPYYALADLFVLPSLSEGSPNVLLEAMVAGVPIVATAVGGVPEMVGNEATALLVPPRNPEALAGAIQRLLSSPELTVSLTSNAAVRVRENFSPETHYAGLCRIYRRVMAAK